MTAFELTDLLEQVGSTYIEEAASPVKRSKKSCRTWLIAAALTVSLLGICAAAGAFNQHSLIHNLQNHSHQNTEGYGQLLVTAPQTEDSKTAADPNAETELQPLVSGKDDVAEYQVLEAILDSESLYTHIYVRPLRDDIILIGEWLDPDSPVGGLENPEITGDMTVREYADSQGKILMRASFEEIFDGRIIEPWGIRGVTQTDGSIHLYGSGQNPSGAKELQLLFVGLVFKVGEYSPLLDRTILELTLEDKSSSDEVVYKHFQAYDPESPDLEKDLGIIIDSLTMKKTELGIYATFTYHPTEKLLMKIDEEIALKKEQQPTMETDEYGYPAKLICSPEYIREQYMVRFIMLNENGEFFKDTGPSGGDRGIIENGDGTYSYTYTIPKHYRTENLKFRILTGDQIEVGTYAFSR